jgi:hypothetical protein
LYNPEEAVPTYSTSGFPGTPATSATLPANIAGPMARHDRPPSGTDTAAGPCRAKGWPAVNKTESVTTMAANYMHMGPIYTHSSLVLMRTDVAFSLQLSGRGPLMNS